MKNLIFKAEDFCSRGMIQTYLGEISGKTILVSDAVIFANEKLATLIEASPTVYGYGITPMASSLWNMNGPEEERCPHTHQAKLMFIEPLAKDFIYVDCGIALNGERLYRKVER